MKVTLEDAKTFVHTIQSGSLSVDEQLKRLKMFLRNNVTLMNSPTKKMIRAKIKHLRNYCVINKRSR